MNIAIVGAPRSGKTHLTQALQQQRPDLQFSDAPSLSQHGAAFDLILLTGLDLPGHDTPEQHAADSALRTQLDQAGWSYRVVYGLGDQRLHQALRLISPEESPPPRWTGLCERCGDPDCERRTLLPRG